MKKDPDAAPLSLPPSCGNCGRGADIHDPEKIVCSVHLDYRRVDGGGNCAYYSRKRQHLAQRAQSEETTEKAAS